ncbi:MULTISPECIES: CoA pyrophosphatase [unclassified Paenibacillus]|uniref:NUDIX hydrolase n=1 Tax=unclassified Paenibacillus TaxID=185978 RepID=UPI001B5285A8|nr:MULTISPECIES: CoA pyrophosphatase [unclassified Paenibacillus]MBP1155363.1 8-oxo-dGTP pyrophosphatase MutT (NUDIX family) [Paenibacillus sp. PvP091]MBP1169253.1 8-oxo-dGTP pyrophosphatase MutT (NUDIX family) [Paenibacillus sp. PvR098]MBP2440280.1 8-oxo-dGTP pyrophosphatase MutT (NUDIX family) [Paenibacillus sp. PvP052]
MRQIYEALQSRKSELMGHQHFFKYAVMVPLVEINGELNVLFEERAHHLNRQPGEICFPGGKIDEDDADEMAAAVRETCEELGLDQQAIELLGPLDYMITSFHIVYPFAARISDYDQIRPNPDEVASVFGVPLEYLRSSTPELHYVDLSVSPRDDFPYDRIPNGRNYKWGRGTVPEFFYYYEGRVIWGLTARILNHFLEVTKSNNDQQS